MPNNQSLTVRLFYKFIISYIKLIKHLVFVMKLSMRTRVNINFLNNYFNAFIESTRIQCPTHQKEEKAL